MTCTWCDAEAIYLRPYFNGKRRGRYSSMGRVHACVKHAPRLRDMLHAIQIRRIDGKPIDGTERLGVFGVKYQSVHGHHSRSAIL